MRKHIRIWLGGVLAVATVSAIAGWYMNRHGVAVIDTAGQVGDKQRNLLFACALLSVLVVVPVFWLLIHFSYKYREGNKNAQYHPHEHGNWQIEAVWWLIPTLLMVVISTITWRSSYALDPFKPLESSKKPLTVEVVAMDWKWLFIYPDQNVASVNEAAIPVDTSVQFKLTSDTVMSSFWVPQLGGQMYAMTGMNTNLHLMASRTGDFRGSDANISGKGFADMHFMVRSMSDADFETWIQAAKGSDNSLTTEAYAKLAKPGAVKKPMFYSSAEAELYDTIMMKYMMPSGDTETGEVNE